MRVKQIMSHPIVSAPVACTAGLAARLMWEYDVGIVPLVDEEGRLTGVVTDRDICMAAYIQGHPLGAIAVASAMAPDVVTCREDDSVEKAELLMREHRIRRVPVVDLEGRPVGILSLNDVGRAVALMKKSTTADRAFVLTLAKVGRPRTQRNTSVETPAA